ncbi:MAG: hypothetical protein FWG11_09045, partial [Promicromonosporaceae bacterium]|nr:hypothetical protein [Promicromonosporaceae bacterium]
PRPGRKSGGGGGASEDLAAAVVGLGRLVDLLVAADPLRPAGMAAHASQEGRSYNLDLLGERDAPFADARIRGKGRADDN